MPMCIDSIRTIPKVQNADIANAVSLIRADQTSIAKPETRNKIEKIIFDHILSSTT
jgi:hypothetical protein